MIWTHNGLEVTEPPEGVVGFIYEITSLIDDKKYIGKKLFKFTRRKLIKGKKKKVEIASDWLKYYGSNERLNEDVVAFGEENFRREILHYCYSKSEMSYMETSLQFEKQVLLSDKYYNSWISCKIHKANIKKLYLQEKQ